MEKRVISTDLMEEDYKIEITGKESKEKQSE